MIQPIHARVYLTVPFSEKDEAKRHAARWDPVVKRWWISRSDIPANPAINKWISDSKGPETGAPAHDLAGKRPRAKARREGHHAPRSSPRTDFSLPDCSCPDAPWEHCQHTTPLAGVRP